MSVQTRDAWAITNVRIFTGDHIIQNGHIVVRNNLISTVGPGELPHNTKQSMLVYSKPGHTLLPGLIDAHIHASGGVATALEQSLKFGVTTVCDMHNDFEQIERLKKLASDPAQIDTYADFKYAGYGATVDGGWPEPVITAHDKSEETAASIATWPRVNQPSDAENFVQMQVDAGASYIKIMHEAGRSLSASFPRASPATLKATVDAAHAHGLKAVGHALGYRDTIELLESGVDGLTHTFADEPSSDDYISLYKRNNAHCNPTLGTHGSLTTEGQRLQEQYANHPFANRLITDQDSRERLCQCISMGKTGSSVSNAYSSVRALHKAGVPILVGSDSAGPALGTAYGLSTHLEMHVLIHEAGMSAMDVLKSATSLNASRFGFHDRGSVQQGKKADLLLIEGDAVELLERKDTLILPIKGVWRDGIAVKDWESVVG